MNAILLLLQISFPLLLGSLATVYLQAVTRRILIRTCGTGEGAEFWLRMSAVANLATPLALVLVLGRAAPSCDPPTAAFLIEAARQAAYLSLIGLMGALALVARAMWRQVPAVAAAPKAAAA